jgi:16S rRNA G966 N2-methylase RsmD
VRALRLLCRRGERFNLVLADPPYTKENSRESEAKKVLYSLLSYDILSPGAFLALEHFAHDSLEGEYGHIRLIKEKRYGDTALSLFETVKRGAIE